jgi:sulfide dehydrogenase [flavocytochrome c] flavoprotein subunit
MLKPGAQDAALHAWKAGAQTVALRAQLEAMPDGGVYAMTIPPAPYRCPPGPYERASQIAFYFSRHKPKSKVLILDANDDVVSKGPLFKKVWKERYPASSSTVQLRSARSTWMRPRAPPSPSWATGCKADVLNVIPPQRAGAIAVQGGLANANARWCAVDFLSFESTRAKNVTCSATRSQVAPA